jgi:NADP-dependent 3-hydroxy acid dehydrogenase YdfG
VSGVFVHQPDGLADPGIDQRVDPSQTLAGTLIQRRAGQASMKAMAIPASAIAEAMAFAIAQPDSVDVGEIVIRPTAQA